jgi:hypothetical protein
MTKELIGDQLLDDIYHVKQFETQIIENPITIGNITEKDKFLAAKQILFGLAALYVFTIIAYLIRPNDSDRLIDICSTTFPPLATLILVSYFKEKTH